MSEKVDKVEDLKLEAVDSKLSHTKHGVGVSIHNPAANDAEQLVHEHDEFTPQEYKKLMLKVDLILMPMLMISESAPSLRPVLRLLLRLAPLRPRAGPHINYSAAQNGP